VSRARLLLSALLVITHILPQSTQRAQRESKTGFFAVFAFFAVQIKRFTTLYSGIWVITGALCLPVSGDVWYNKNPM
jgi:hypothetical protein